MKIPALVDQRAMRPNGRASPRRWLSGLDLRDVALDCVHVDHRAREVSKAEPPRRGSRDQGISCDPGSNPLRRAVTSRTLRGSRRGHPTRYSRRSRLLLGDPRR